MQRPCYPDHEPAQQQGQVHHSQQGGPCRDHVSGGGGGRVLPITVPASEEKGEEQEGHPCENDFWLNIFKGSVFYVLKYMEFRSFAFGASHYGSELRLMIGCFRALG